MTKETTDQLECLGRTFCFQLYKRRFELYAKDDSDSETEDEGDDLSLHDTSTEGSSSKTDSEVYKLLRVQYALEIIK